MLMEKGIKSPKAANDIATMGLDYTTVVESIDNLLADRTSIPAIVGFLRSNPPEPGKPYPRKRSMNSPPLIATRPNIPTDVLTPAQIAQRSRELRGNHDPS